MKASDLPRVNTPEGGWKGEMPGPFLVACDEPITEGFPDLRGTWKPVELVVNGEPAPADVPLWQHVERIEQAGSRVTITSGGVIHDFPSVDGTFENGCHDVAAMDFTTPIIVAASFEDGVLVLRPRGLEGVEVRRWRDGEHLTWDYHGAFTMRLARIDSEN
ncbi:MAG: hypothetical protein FJW53_04285 [Actinobacteria bacterium]|nr:hypothetical protein [Actinomycetota bacterium]